MLANLVLSLILGFKKNIFLKLFLSNQVMASVGDSFDGNAGDYRIDGWCEVDWFQQYNATLATSK